jgi:hypothetical protein
MRRKRLHRFNFCEFRYVITANLKHGSHGHLLRQERYFGMIRNILEEGCYGEGHFSEIRILFAAHGAPETKFCYKLQVTKILLFYAMAVQPKFGRSSPEDRDKGLAHLCSRRIHVMTLLFSSQFL